MQRRGLGEEEGLGKGEGLLGEEEGLGKGEGLDLEEGQGKGVGWAWKKGWARKEGWVRERGWERKEGWARERGWARKEGWARERGSERGRSMRLQGWQSVLLTTLVPISQTDSGFQKPADFCPMQEPGPHLPEYMLFVQCNCASFLSSLLW